MTETVQRAKQAREKLAAALTLLQSPEAGDLLDTVAEPVARAMGALHTIESSQGQETMRSAPLALDAVRAALAALQDVVSNPAADKATEHIAGSLGLVHSLAEDAKHQKSPSGVSGLDQTQLAGGAAPRAPSARAEEPTAAAPAPPHVSTAPRERKNSKHASAPPEGMPPGAIPAEANLGAHSPTNFYKGLSGNDVVDDGGLFIATYDIPPIGTKLWLTVNMPGGYDFQAVAEVKWTRESGVGDVPPGYGCAFQSLSGDARQLVYRYAKNREPLFHDDL